MRSKFTLALVSGAILLAAAGCLRIGEDRVESGSLGMADSKCLSGGARTFAEYFQGQAEESKISALWDCASRSLTLFSERTRGHTDGVWTSDELKSFLETYFVRDAISPKYMGELMEVKRALIGGDPGTLTRAEITQALKLVATLKSISLELKPYLPLNAEKVSQLDEAGLQRVSSVINQLSRELAQTIRSGGADYTFSHLETLLSELEQMAMTPSAQAHFRTMREMVPLFRELKGILVSPDTTRIASRDWDSLLSDASQWYSLYLRWIHASSVSQSFTHGRGREQAITMLDETIRYLRHALSARPGNLISFEELDRVIDALDPKVLRFHGERIHPAHLKAFLRPLFRRALAGQDRSEEGRDSAGMTISSLKRLHLLAREWSDGQRFIDRGFAYLYGEPGEEVPVAAAESLGYRRSEILSLPIGAVLAEHGEGITRAAREAAERVRTLARQRVPLFNGPELEILLGNDGPNPRFSHKALSMLYLSDFAARLLNDAYAETADDRIKGITLAEFTQFYWDVRELGVDLLILDASNTKLFPRRFAEANLFLSASNGDDRMNLEETAEMLSFSISAKAIGATNRNRIAAICNAGAPRPIPLDAFGAETMDPRCFKQVFFESVDQGWKNLPKLVAYFRGLSASQAQDFIQNFDAAARANPGARVTTSDCESYVGLAQYVESIFERFDQDRSGTISLNEAIHGSDPAFPVFESALKAATCKIGSCVENEYILKSVFTYLLAYGRPPTVAEIAAWSTVQSPFWSFEADRARLVSVLSKLGQANSASSEAR